MWRDCWCCGSQHPPDALVALGGHDEAGLCRDCIGWLAEQLPHRALQRSVPILATVDVSRALRHYAALGFDVEEWIGGGYGFAERDGVELQLGQPDNFEPARNTSGCYLFVSDADRVYEEWFAARVEGELHEPIDTVYGMREGSHTDPDGNTIRFGSPQA